MSENMESMVEGINRSKLSVLEQEIRDLEGRLLLSQTEEVRKKIAERVLALLTEIAVLKGESVGKVTSGYEDDVFSRGVQKPDIEKNFHE